MTYNIYRVYIFEVSPLIKKKLQNNDSVYFSLKIKIMAPNFLLHIVCVKLIKINSVLNEKYSKKRYAIINHNY